eukprot:9472506-Pyramimonas_sp.AAC.3
MVRPFAGTLDPHPPYSRRDSGPSGRRETPRSHRKVVPPSSLGAPEKTKFGLREDCVKRASELCGGLVVLVQEVHRWGDLREFVDCGRIVPSAGQRDCALIVPGSRTRALRGRSSGDYWFGAAAGNVIYISARILDHPDDDGRAQLAFEETSLLVQRVRLAYSSAEFEIVLGVDADVQFPALLNAMTGGAVLDRCQSCSRSKISAVSCWMEPTGVRLVSALRTSRVEVDGVL